jgi:hypothetical protein
MARVARPVHSFRMRDEIGFHSARAMAELDLARCTADSRAARAHLALANEHLARMRELCAAAYAPTVPAALPRTA